MNVEIIDNKHIHGKNLRDYTSKQRGARKQLFENIGECKNFECVVLKNGNKLTGKEFINNLYNYIPNYNTYLDLINDLVDSIEY